MLSISLNPALGILKMLYPYILISLSIWITYWYAATKAGFVSDDIQGILGFDGLLQTRSSQSVYADEKLPEEAKKAKVQELNKRPLLYRLIDSDYGTLSRWLRYQICGGNKPSKLKVKDFKGNDVVVPCGKIPQHHHTLIICVFNIACLLTYHFLQNIIGPHLALLSLVLFAVHPVGVQAVAWASGLGYSLSLLWIAAMLNIAPCIYYARNLGLLITGVILFCGFQFLGIHAQMIPMAACVFLWFLGYKELAVLAAIITAVMVFDIVKQTVDHRVEEFKKQHMELSTKFYPRKFVVAMKTLLYYLGLIFFPRRMGLYHTWGFHYSKEIESFDHLFFLGLAAFAGFLGIFFLSPAIPVKFGILWFLATSVIFWNWVTIQQWVTERYAFIPSLGLCILITYYTQNYFWIYTLILGLYLCRSWMHLPTYDNELRFYESNHWNFPDSEVALGNLGVARINIGLEGMAMDSWRMATLANPEYDVPLYNLFSTHKTKAVMALQQGRYEECLGQLQTAYPYLEKTLKCKVCHFPDIWKKEQEEIYNTLRNPSVMFQQELQRLEQLAHNLEIMKIDAKTPKRLQEVEESIQNNNVQIAGLRKFLKESGIPQIQGFNILTKLFKKENA